MANKCPTTLPHSPAGLLGRLPPRVSTAPPELHAPAQVPVHQARPECRLPPASSATPGRGHHPGNTRLESGHGRKAPSGRESSQLRRRPPRSPHRAGAPPQFPSRGLMGSLNPGLLLFLGILKMHQVLSTGLSRRLNEEPHEEQGSCGWGTQRPPPQTSWPPSRLGTVRSHPRLTRPGWRQRGSLGRAEVGADSPRPASTEEDKQRGRGRPGSWRGALPAGD